MSRYGRKKGKKREIGVPENTMESPQVQPSTANPTSSTLEPPQSIQEHQVQAQVKPRRQPSRFKPPKTNSENAKKR
uniref:Uncharacterized protein n=1 Tax=Lupinus angustifolius TaxID=3871 RepID=L0P2D7_LUPAN|nr:hypothetical protein [Lupinus angustifolius]